MDGELVVNSQKGTREKVGSAWGFTKKKNTRKNRRIKHTNVFRMLRGTQQETLVLSGSNTHAFAKSVLVGGTASLLLSISLTGLGIESAEILETCVNLRSCYLSQNKIVNFPMCVLKLPHLKTFDLSSNMLYNLDALKHIEHCGPELIALDLQDNTVTHDKKYREYVVSKMPFLMSLDGIIVSPWEFHPLLCKYYRPQVHNENRSESIKT